MARALIPMGRNQLDQETSPYLLQHRDNPVHWRPWGAGALAAARDEDKPILLSIGYAACHWCHVMAHESFEDQNTAQLINDLYIPIKVDREERPDLDILYQTALAMLGQQGGWPLTMFLTPAGEPFWGGTYFPPTPLFGRPSFRDVLTGIASVYRDQHDKVAGNVALLKDALERQSQPESGQTPSVEWLDHAAGALLSAVDTAEGGLQGAPKFPQMPLFAFLWRAALKSGDARLREAVTLTLERMSNGGIYDHLGGGFARYATDQHWLVPHFEKMLYDNAELVGLLTLVWQDTRTPLFAWRIAETIGWLEREMMAENGAFAASLDADSEGVEGKYYVWTEEEIDSLLPADRAQAFKQAYDVRADGNWEAVSILNRSHPQPRAGDTFERQLAEDRAILLAERQKRVPPGRDDKVLADWNGLMIASLANAAFVFDRADWLALAEGAFAAVRDHSTRPDGDGTQRLVHSRRLGRGQPEAVLDDYAHMARAAMILYEVTGRSDYLTQAAAWVAAADRHYWDDTGGGYFFTADDAADILIRTKSAADHPTPAGNAVLLEILARLFLQTGEEAYRQRAEAIMAAFAGEVDKGFPSMGTLLNSWQLLNAAVQVVVVGHADDPARRALLRAVAAVSLPDRVLTLLSPQAILPAAHPAAGKVAAASSACAFVCRGPVCSLPLADAEALQNALRRG
jgi:uncharacterized protein